MGEDDCLDAISEDELLEDVCDVGLDGHRIARLAAAAGGAVVGAWLGFHVTAAGFGAFAPLLAIVGATVGANLIILALDIAADRRLRDRLVEANARETLEARPSTG